MLRANKRKHITIEDENQRMETLYPHELQMYLSPPSGQLSLMELEKCCSERLTVLQLVDAIACDYRGSHAIRRKRHLRMKLCENNLDDYVELLDSCGCGAPTENNLKLRRRDHFSYYMLQAAFAKDRRKQRWLTKQETRWFRWRLSSLNEEGLRKLLKIHGFPEPISRMEKMEVLLELKNAMKTNDIDDISFYQIQWNEITNTIKNRMVYVKKGMAYIPQTLIPLVVTAYFRKAQRIGYKHIKKLMSEIHSEDKLVSIFSKCRECIKLGDGTSCNSGLVQIEDLDMLSKTSYPLCMRIVHETVKRTHHLRNIVRVQYTLFLKGIGLTARDNITFWEKEFLQNMTIETFNKKYRYHFRHLYGLEGRKADYQPLKCLQIMDNYCRLGEIPGCPFQCLSGAMLKQKLEQYGVSPLAIENITKLAALHQYDKACGKYFEYTHGVKLTKEVTHPNKYFDESQKILSSTMFASDDDV